MKDKDTISIFFSISSNKAMKNDIVKEIVKKLGLN